MSKIVEYSSKSAAKRGVARMGINASEVEDFIAKSADGKFHVDKDMVDQALGLAGANEEDENLILTCGHSHCPHCGIHLSNGLSDFDGMVDLHGSEAAAIKVQSHEWSCLGCNGEWGAEIEPRKARTTNKTGRRYENREMSTDEAKQEGPSAIVFGIADANPELDRKAVVEAAVNRGVTKNTANAAYQHWRKARGLVKSRD